VDNVAVLNVRIPDDIHHQAKVAAVIANISLKEFVVRALAEKLEREAKGAKR
jgi:predicted HicB family RNase H-like nuclease